MAWRRHNVTAFVGFADKESAAAAKRAIDRVTQLPGQERPLEARARVLKKTLPCLLSLPLP